LGNPLWQVLNLITVIKIKKGGDLCDLCDLQCCAKQYISSFPSTNNKIGGIFYVLHCDVRGLDQTGSLSSSLLGAHSLAICIYLMKKVKDEQNIHYFLSYGKN